MATTSPLPGHIGSEQYKRNRSPLSSAPTSSALPLPQRLKVLKPQAQIALLLLLATLLDHVTGPAVSAAAFYIFPVGLAGWYFGGRIAGLIAALAAVLNAATIWLALAPHGFTPDLLASQGLHAVVYGVVAFLTTYLRQEKQLLKEERDQVEQLRGQMAEEMHAARTLQELLFQSPPSHPAVELGTFMATARILGGDALDVSLSGDRLAALVADVSGKGSPAALATAVLLGMLEDCPERFTSPARTLEFLNRRLVSYLPDEMFVTALYVLLDLETGTLTWASSGHEPPLLLSATSSPVVETLESAGGIGNMPLAILAGASYEDYAREFAPGDVLLCYTDGLTDLRLPSGERLGREKMRTLFAHAATRPCTELLPAMLAEATGADVEELQAGGLEDDLSMVALRRR
jgi:serine phosphatase RsbU (regulator of sigma subunit)